MNKKKLFIPGPVQVSEQVLAIMKTQMIYHRSNECKELISDIKGLISELLQTKNEVMLITSSATGAMETAVRSCIQNNVLCIANGEFGRRWYEIAKGNGKNAKLLDFGDGKNINYAMVADELRKKQYEAVTFVINETSTGVENDAGALKQAVQSVSKDVLIFADAVTAAFGIKIVIDDADLVLFGTQKSLALPPGLSILIANEKAIRKAEHVNNRGYYFDLILIKEYNDKNLPLTTPPISLMYALKHRLQEIRKQGMENLIQEHAKKTELVRNWMNQHGFNLFVPEGYSNTLTVVCNNLEVDVPRMIKLLAASGYVIANGYGPLKNKTFRISHMGDISFEDTKQLLNEMEKILCILQPSHVKTRVLQPTTRFLTEKDIY